MLAPAAISNLKRQLHGALLFRQNSKITPD
jgi:hypothetical protein